MASMEFQTELKRIIKETPGNELCVDCREPNPTWASVNLGVFMCLACSGVHRAMGVHISFVKSTTLDKWTPQLVANMRNGGNVRANTYFEAGLPSHYPRPRTMKEREDFIRKKYQDRKWVVSGTSTASSPPTTSSSSDPEPSQRLREPISTSSEPSGGRKKRIPPSQRRLMQQQDQSQGQEEQSSKDLLGVDSFEEKMQHQPSNEATANRAGSVDIGTSGGGGVNLFQNMSIKVPTSSSNGERIQSSREQNEIDLLLSFSDSTIDQNQPQTTELDSKSHTNPQAVDDGHHSFLSRFGIDTNIATPVDLPVMVSEDAFAGLHLGGNEATDDSTWSETSQIPLGNAHAMAAIDSLNFNTVSSNVIGGGQQESSVVEESLNQISTELVQIAEELEQAKLNLHIFLEAKQTLLQSKNRLEQLNGHLDTIQMKRLDGLQGLDHETLGRRKTLNTQVSALVHQIQAIHTSMTSSLN